MYAFVTEPNPATAYPQPGLRLPVRLVLALTSSHTLGTSGTHSANGTCVACLHQRVLLGARTSDGARYQSNYRDPRARLSSSPSRCTETKK